MTKGGVVSLLVSTLLWLPKKLIFEPIIEFATTKYRWALVIPIVLPMSFIFYVLTNLRNKLIYWTSSSPKRHDERVARVVTQVKNRERFSPNTQMCTARPSWHSMSIWRGVYKNTMFKVDLSSFIDVLEINEQKQTVRVEPLVTCGQLSATLLPLGWTCSVLPELDDLTIGGLIAGFGVETSSHKYGLFQYICESFEIVLADGTYVKCSAESNPELFYSIPWSHGTIGFLVAAEIKIVRSKNFVKLSYEPFTRKETFLKEFDAASRDETNDFVEALCYSPDKYVLMKGTMTNAVETSKVHEIGKWYGPWFYKNAEIYLDKNKAGVEYIPLRDYYHRHTRSLFWEMHDIVPFGNNILFRLLLGWLLPPKVSFLKLTTTPRLHQIYKQKHVDQDLLIPMETLGGFIDKSEELFGMYPIWLCPCKIMKTPVRGLINPDSGDEMYVDVGLYGVPRSARPEGGDNFNTKEGHKAMEAYVREIKGYQALYAITYMTREEFYQMFDHSTYERVRERYHCQGALPVIYDKVSIEARGEN